MRKVIEVNESASDKRYKSNISLVEKLSDELNTVLSNKLKFCKSEIEFGDSDGSRSAKLDDIATELDHLLGMVKKL